MCIFYTADFCAFFGESMPKETMTERNSNPKYYEPVRCSNCNGKDDLLKHKFTEDLMCITCVNILLTSLADANETVVEEEQEQEFRERTWFFDHPNYNELQQEREA